VALDHHKLDVYKRALALLALCDEIVHQLPKGRTELKEQLDRAAGSVVANIAEGAGEFRGREKARFYRMARRSAVEVAAWIEIASTRGEVSPGSAERALQELESIVGMLIRLAQASER
jgi:four helix bundle protein